ncbi:MAG TPA: FtsW/RodA/SpoVE family cell cycle protein [Acidimicrobiales bacterium]|nr:FtsW/RodA/SpoVE family cell cycle protein [Acidimicrobiales bacterium]
MSFLGAVVQPARRRTELGLVLLVGLVTVGAVTLASLGKVGEPPAGLLALAGVMVALLLAAHLAVRKLAPAADPVILPVALLLNGLGYTMISRLDSELAALQAVWTAVGVAAFVGTLWLVRRARDLERYRYSFLALGLVLLLLPLVPGLGRNINGARIWIRLGPIGFQPGELAKIVLAIFFASYLVERRELLADRIRFGPLRLPRPRLRVLLPLLVAWGVSIVVMVAERDLGSSLLFFGLFIGLLWLATGQPVYLIGGGALFALAASVAYQLFSHVQTRVEVWLDPWPTAQGKGYQIVQSMFAFGSGGVTGTGLALGSPQRIPAVATDFIFAAIGEELGLLGTSAVLIAFVLLIGSGLRIALRVDHPFEKLLAAGLTLVLGLQAFIIIAGITRVVPLTGITLPFVSYGGSSLVANFILVALLLRISDQQGPST